MSDLIERLTLMWRAAEYNHKTVGDAIDEIERLQAVVDAAQQLIEQGLPKRTTQDQWNAWHILKDALEDSDE